MVIESTARMRFTFVVDSTNKNTIASKRPACNVRRAFNTLILHTHTQLTHILYKSNTNRLVGNFVFCWHPFIAGEEYSHQKVGYHVSKQGKPEV